MRMIGRLTAPTMAFFIVEGYFHTKNKKKYALRLFIFSLISWLPYSYFEYGKATFHFSVIFTLFLGLMIVWLLDSKINSGYKIFGIVLILFFSFLADWMIFVPLWCISFLALERNKKAIGYGLYPSDCYFILVSCYKKFSSMDRHLGNRSIFCFSNVKAILSWRIRQ